MEIMVAVGSLILAVIIGAWRQNWTDNTGWLGEAGTECSWLGLRCYVLI